MQPGITAAESLPRHQPLADARRTTAALPYGKMPAVSEWLPVMSRSTGASLQEPTCDRGDAHGEPLQPRQST